MKHTPRPWEAINLNKENTFPGVYIGPELRYPDGSGSFRARITINEGPTPESVALGEGFGTTTETADANARLIAAAPDLLEALQIWMQFFDEMPKGQLGKISCDIGLLNDGFIKSARAIKKATD